MSASHSPSEDSDLRALHRMVLRAAGKSPHASIWTVLAEARKLRHPTGKADRRTVLWAGLYLEVDVGERLGCDFFYGVFSETAQARIVTSALSKGEMVLDIGANFGFYTVLSAEAVGATGSVMAFEPHPGARELLERNCGRNGFAEVVRIEPVAVGRMDGEIDFNICEESAFSGMTDTGRSRVKRAAKTSVTKLDSVVPGDAEPALIKIDVEGHEGDVLLGARDLLQRAKDPLVFFEVSQKNLDEHRRGALREACEMLTILGYVGWQIHIGKGRLEEITLGEDVLKMSAANVLVMRRGGGRQKKLENAMATVLARRPVKARRPAPVRSIRVEAELTEADTVQAAVALAATEASLEETNHLERELRRHIELLGQTEQESRARLREIEGRAKREEQLRAAADGAQREIAVLQSELNRHVEIIQRVEVEKQQVLHDLQNQRKAGRKAKAAVAKGAALALSSEAKLRAERDEMAEAIKVLEKEGRARQTAYETQLERAQKLKGSLEALRAECNLLRKEFDRHLALLKTTEAESVARQKDIETRAKNQAALQLELLEVKKLMLENRTKLTEAAAERAVKLEAESQRAQKEHLELGKEFDRHLALLKATEAESAARQKDIETRAKNHAALKRELELSEGNALELRRELTRHIQLVERIEAEKNELLSLFSDREAKLQGLAQPGKQR